MPSGRHPTEFFRNLNRLLDRMVEPRPPGDRARVAAQSVVAGLSEQVQASVPALRSEEVEHLLVNLVLVFDRLVGEAAKSFEAGERGVLAQHLAEGLVRGLVGELKAATPELQARVVQMVDEVRAELDQLLSERRAEHEPGEQGYRARVLGEGAVRGVSAELQRQIPEIEQALRALAPAGRVVASQFVRQALTTLVESSGELIAALELVSESASRKAVQGLFAELEVQLRKAQREESADAAQAVLERRVGQLAAAVVRGVLDAVATEARARQVAPRTREAILRGGRAGVEGVLAALKPRVRRPLLWCAGIGAAVALALLTRKARA